MKKSVRWLGFVLLLSALALPSMLSATDGNPSGPPPKGDGNPSGPPPIVRQGPII